MKGALIALCIAMLLLVIVFINADVHRRSGTIDVHLHDTYFVLSYFGLFIFLLLFLGTFFSVGGMLGSWFRSNLFWILTVLFLSVDAYYLVSFSRQISNAENAQYSDEQKAP